METTLLHDLAIVMAAAAAMTLLCYRLKQPVVIGYLLAGLLIGPYTPPFSFVQNLTSIHTLAELGLVFLMFSLGLEFSLPKIGKVGLSAGVAAVLEVASMLVIGYALGRLFGWSRMDSVFLGAILSISSTTIIVKVFMDFGMLKEKFVQVVFGILILEDIVAVAILSILSGLGAKDGVQAGAVILSIFQIGLFVTLFIVFGLLLIPKFMHWVGGFKSREVLGITTLGICLGGAYVAHHFRLSVALGAFLAGAVLAASNEIHEIDDWIRPVRDMFSAIFFISAGMLIRPSLLWEYKGAILAVTVVTIIGKVLSGAVGSYLAGYDLKTSSRVGMSVAQIGEFSFVIASLGLSLNVTSDFLYPMAVTVSSLTTLATPYLIKNSDAVVDAMLNVMPASVPKRMEGYSAWLEKMKPVVSDNHHAAVLSRYAFRLGVYFAVFVFLVGVAKAMAYWKIAGLVWLVASALAMPLFLVISKHANHILLLVVTRNKAILRRINVHLFYSVFDRALIGLLCIVMWGIVYIHLGSGPGTLMVAACLAVEFLARRKLRVVADLLEKNLDYVVRLAASEPAPNLVLPSGFTDQFSLTAASPACGRSIRDLDLRANAGASIIAIYRSGAHIANPPAETVLEIDDVLILIGSEVEIGRTKQLLTGPVSA